MKCHLCSHANSQPSSRSALSMRAASVALQQAYKDHSRSGMVNHMGMDLLGLGILHELSAAGVDVPRELALVGFDDTQFGEASLIPLSSIRGRHEGFGEAIVDLLFDAIARGGKPVPDPHKVFAPDLVVRTSSAGFVRP